jgi:phospholipid/cholesterol/gamma-HCH transport system ATP-binding protein
MIRLENIYKNFGNLDVLKGINLEINKGDSMVVFGASGSGKSVMLKLIMGLLKPDKGEIYVDDKNINELKRSELDQLRTRFGMLFQGAALFDSMTVYENVTLGRSEHGTMSSEERIECARRNLEMVGLGGTEQKYPAQLSGGMKKRVGLARALCMEPEIILYDEPTTGLDPVSADKINDLIIELRDKLKITSIAVTHDLYSAFRIGQRFAMLYQGNIRFDGTREEMEASDDEVLKDFLSHSAINADK